MYSMKIMEFWIKTLFVLDFFWRYSLQCELEGYHDELHATITHFQELSSQEKYGSMYSNNPVPSAHLKINLIHHILASVNPSITVFNNANSFKHIYFIMIHSLSLLSFIKYSMLKFQILLCEKILVQKKST